MCRLDHALAVESETARMMQLPCGIHCVVMTPEDLVWPAVQQLQSPRVTMLHACSLAHQYQYNYK